MMMILQKSCACGCGKLLRATEKDGRPNRCRFVSGHHIKGDRHPSWKGGRTKVQRGYIKRYAPNHPFAYYDRYVLEHRLVMEEHLGRYLSKNEHVHHINGIRDDNRLENLQLLPEEKHWGIHLKVDWTKRFCYLCKAKTGVAKWCKHPQIKGEFVCNKCHYKLKRDDLIQRLLGGKR